MTAPWTDRPAPHGAPRQAGEQVAANLKELVYGG